MYQIVIKKIEKKTETSNGNWTIIDKRPYTEEELENVPPHNRSRYNDELKEVYGYPPPHEKEVEREVKVLEQTVDELDLVEVIKAINGIDL